MEFFFVFTDCANLGSYPNGKLGYRFSSQQEMDVQIATHFKCRHTSKLPMYSQNEDMVLDQLYQTGKQLNVDCCHFHVMRTQKPGEPGPCGFYVEVDDAMFDQVFWSN